MEIVFLLQYNLYKKKYEKYNKTCYVTALSNKCVFFFLSHFSLTRLKI